MLLLFDRNHCLPTFIFKSHLELLAKKLKSKFGNNKELSLN